MNLSFDRSTPGHQGVRLPDLDVPEAPLPEAAMLREGVRLPELSQLEVLRYFTALSRLNYSIASGVYPLGSCTMKYNPTVHEDVAALAGFAALHPSQPAETAQGALAVLYDLQAMLAAITGMDGATLAPMAGAQGEFTGILMIKALLRDAGQDGRTRVLIPDSAHGTNPATAAMCGFEVVSIPTAPDGGMDLDVLGRELDGRTAALMLTLPNTLGLWERNILRIAAMVHEAGALLYGDGANLNAIAGQIRPGDLGFDAWHINVHKTFSTPHGGGGPGAGPVTVAARLLPYLPEPHAVRGEDGLIRLVRPERSIGRLSQFHGNFGVLLRAYTYLRTLGAEGIREMSEAAVVHANYLQARLRGAYRLPYDRRVMHEVVFSASRQRAKNGVRTLDIAKRLIDYGYHPPTVYFPLIVEEALMIEPTEAESKDSIDAFCEAMLSIAREAAEQPELLKEAPTDAPLRRLDEATAARRPVLRWQPAKADAPAQPTAGAGDERPRGV
jgi:glycine dehydrogenase subunit 2